MNYSYFRCTMQSWSERHRSMSSLPQGCYVVCSGWDLVVVIAVIPPGRANMTNSCRVNQECGAWPNSQHIRWRQTVDVIQLQSVDRLGKDRSQCSKHHAMLIAVDRQDWLETEWWLVLFTRKKRFFKQEIRSVELGVCPMQLFHFWSRDVHPVQNMLLCRKFHKNPMIFHWDTYIHT